jgi:hypothetical protein
MVDPSPDDRPSIDDVLNELKGISNTFKRMKSFEVDKFNSLNELQRSILQDNEYRKYFKSHLRSEFSVESVLFFEDVQIFSKIESDQERFSKAEEICHSYLYETSPLEINVSGNLKNNFSSILAESKLIGEIEETIFDEICKHVSDTILLDAFPRFERSEICQALHSWIGSFRKKSTMKKSILKNK